METENLIKDVVDRFDKFGHVPDLFIKAGLALAGYRINNHWTGALSALLALRLAESRNLAAGAAGVLGLGAVGLNTMFRHAIEAEKPCPEGYTKSPTGSGECIPIVTTAVSEYPWGPGTDAPIGPAWPTRTIIPDPEPILPIRIHR